MADLLWDDVERFFDAELMGRLPDACVPDTSVQDWQRLLDLVVETGWQHEYSEGQTAMAWPHAEAVFARPADAEIAELRVWPVADMLAIFRFWSPDQIDFDIDLWEIHGQERLDVLCSFFAAIGRRLAKPVLMGAEGGHIDRPVLGFDLAADEVVALDD